MQWQRKASRCPTQLHWSADLFPSSVIWWHRIFPAPSRSMKFQRSSATTTSRRKPLSWNGFTFTNATKPRGRLLPNLTQHSGSLQLIACFRELSKILSEIALCAVYETNPSNADCCRKKISNIGTPWRSRTPWRPLTEISSLSRVLNLRFVNCTSYSARVREKYSCYRCGRTNHSTTECKFKDGECYHCGEKGHIAPACRSKAKSLQPIHSLPKSAGVAQGRSKKNHRRTHHVHSEVEASISDSDASSGEGYHLHKLHDRSSNPINVPVFVNGRQLTMELDTGAAVSIISEETRKTLFVDQKLRKSTLVLKTYTEEPMQVVGQLNVRVKYGIQEAKLVLVVVGGNGPSLFGCNWLKCLRLDWSNIAVVRAVQQKSLNILLKQHQQLFTDVLGKVEPYKATLQVQPDATPGFFKSRSMLLAIKASVG